MTTEANKQHKEMYQAQRHIAENLRFLRYIHGFSQKQMAEAVHMSRSCYCQLENGGKLPDLITVYKLSEFFGISLDYLLSFDITDHLLSMLRHSSNHLESRQFVSKYLQLSHGARRQIEKRIEELAEQEKSFNYFPWDYSVSGKKTKREKTEKAKTGTGGEGIL